MIMPPSRSCGWPNRWTPRAPEFARIPPSTLAIVRRDAAQRTEAERNELMQHYLSVAPGLKSEREELANLKQKLEESKPYTSVPIFRELAGDKRRKTHVQRR